jgi:hypothetical protein
MTNEASKNYSTSFGNDWLAILLCEFASQAIPSDGLDEKDETGLPD